MSTPSGKPFDPFDLSPYAPKRARERSPLEQKSDGKEGEGKEDIPSIVLPYAPRAALPLADAAAPEHPLDLDSIDKEPTPPPAGPLAEPVAETSPAAADTPAVPVTEVDPEMARLEASLQWIQREGNASRLPRAASLPPVSGLRAPSPEGLRPHGEQFINGVRVPPSLAPQRLRPPPMGERRDSLRAPVRVLLAAAIAAPIAYYFSIGGFSSKPAENAREPGLASLASRLVASTEFPIPKDAVPPGEADDYNTMVSSQNKLVAAEPAPATKVAPARIETPAPTAVVAPAPAPAPLPVPPSPAVEQPAPAATAMREMDPASIKLLMQQGEGLLAAGDVIAARRVFQRAAEAGNAAAALALGASYDPDVLAKMGARGISADIAKARLWYERAQQYGSADAPRRLEALANR